MRWRQDVTWSAREKRSPTWRSHFQKLTQLSCNRHRRCLILIVRHTRNTTLRILFHSQLSSLLSSFTWEDTLHFISLTDFWSFKKLSISTWWMSLSLDIPLQWRGIISLSITRELCGREPQEKKQIHSEENENTQEIVTTDVILSKQKRSLKGLSYTKSQKNKGKATYSLFSPNDSEISIKYPSILSCSSCNHMVIECIRSLFIVVCVSLYRQTSMDTIEISNLVRNAR